jgi:hypothetical protein
MRGDNSLQILINFSFHHLFTPLKLSFYFKHAMFAMFCQTHSLIDTILQTANTLKQPKKGRHHTITKN